MSVNIHPEFIGKGELATPKTTKDLVSNRCQPICVSAIHYDNPVGKRLEKSSDGLGLDKTSLLGERNKVGQPKILSFNSADEAFQYRLSSDARTMFLAGTFDPNSVLEAIGPRWLVEAAQGQFEPEEFYKFGSATKEYLAFREGPAQLLIDIDPPKASELFPGPIVCLTTEEEVREVILTALPECSDAPMLIVPSASSLVEDKVTGKQLAGPGGWRVIIIVEDGRDIPDILKVIHMRAWAREGWHYAFVDRGGRVQVRSLADQALGRPTQPDYPTADLGEGLCRSKVGNQKFCLKGPYLPSGSVVLSDEERKLAEDRIREAKHALRPQKEKVRATLVSKHVKTLVDLGVQTDDAQRAAEARIKCHVILGSDNIVLDDGVAVPVSEILSNDGAKYDGRLCLDALEPKYDGGRVVGKIYWNDGKNPGSYSFARGSQFYKFRYDLPTLLLFLENGSILDSRAVVRALALSHLSPLELKQALKAAAKKLRLGNATRQLENEVNCFRKEHQISSKLDDVEDDDNDIMSVCPMSERLDNPMFPKTRIRDGHHVVIDHIENVRYLLARYGISMRYNEIIKEIEWSHPDLNGTGDNSDNALMSYIISLSNLNGLPIKSLLVHLTALAEEMAYNPVTDYLSSLKYDGIPRLSAFAQRAGTSDLAVRGIAIRIFFLQACAAADHAAQAQKVRPASRAHFESVVVFVGQQGAGKTKGIRRLIPIPLRKFFKEGLTLDPKNKDSIKQAVSCWIAELGELDATFRKADIAQLKAFLSNDTDEIRMPYAPKSSKFKRRSCFVGSVNEPNFLADRTGNRRFIPLEVSSLTDLITEDEVDLLWAEAWQRYSEGESWWPSDLEAELLSEHTDTFRSKSWIEEELGRKYDWTSNLTKKPMRLTATAIYGKLQGSGGVSKPTQGELSDIAISLRRYWSKHPDTHLVEGKLMVSVDGQLEKVHISGGKENGWFLPVEKVSNAACSFS